MGVALPIPAGKGLPGTKWIYNGFEKVEDPPQEE
jgi:hypothetical protein